MRSLCISMVVRKLLGVNTCKWDKRKSIWTNWFSFVCTLWDLQYINTHKTNKWTQQNYKIKKSTNNFQYFPKYDCIKMMRSQNSINFVNPKVTDDTGDEGPKIRKIKRNWDVSPVWHVWNFNFCITYFLH